MMPFPLTRRALIRAFGASAGAIALGPRLSGRSRAATAANLIDATHRVQAGETATAAKVVTWRVLRGEIDTTGSDLLARAAGFVLPERGPGLFVTEGGDESTAVTGDDAAFVSEGAKQRYASLGPEPTRYLRIGLVTLKDADFPADGELVTRPPHPELEPPGRVRLELYRVTIVQGEKWELPAGIGLPLAITFGGSLKFRAGETEIALRAGKAAVLAAETGDGPWVARCPKGTADAELLVAIIADPGDAPAAGQDPGETAEPEGTAPIEPAAVTSGSVTIRVLRCATTAFDDTCVVRADAGEVERYRLVLLGPVNPDRTTRADTVYYPLTAETEQNPDGSVTFRVAAGLYEFGSRGEGKLPTRLDGQSYDGEPFPITGDHTIEVITPNW